MRLLTITIALAVTASQALASNDPLYVTSGSWGQDYADQWALRTVLEDPERVQTLVGSAAQPVVVAMIDTGLDWDHLDFSSENLWNNNDVAKWCPIFEFYNRPSRNMGRIRFLSTHSSRSIIL